MGSWTIYDKTGVAKAVVKELELHDEWMAECFITATINSATPIQFAVGDYIDYRNERYTIEYDPNVIKRATSGTYGEGFVYDGIKFLGSQDEIVRCDFNDLVLDPDSPSNKAHYTTLPTFPFYCESVDDLLDRIQANLEELYPNEWIVIGLNTVRNSQRGLTVGRQTAFENAYKQWVDPDMTPNTEPYGKQSVAESADNITCWDALTKVHDDFGLNFIVRGKVVVVGTAGVFTSNTFHYGKGNGLTEIERIGDTSQQIITRLRAYGSETNLPLHYYSTLNKRVYATVTNIKNKFGTQGVEFLLDLDFDDKYFTNQSKSYPKSGNYANYIVTLSANDCSVRGYVTKDYNSKACYVYCEYTGGLDDRDEPNATAMAAFVNALAVNDRVDFIDYIKKDSFGDGHYDYATTSLPDNMCISRLMLPMFPNTSLYDWVKEHRDEGADFDDTTGRTTYHGVTAYFSKEAQRPYIDSLNKDLYGIRPASIYFDGSNETTDIHPTIEGMGVDQIVSADQIEDNGVYDDSTIDVPNFNIILPDLGFELDKVYDQNASIDMKDGMCGGRSFKLASVPVKDSNGHWVCECEREKDENLNLFFPYKDFQISTNDHYVLTGIEMPDAYIEAAAIRLLDVAVEALQKNDSPRFTYQPKIDKNFMQRQHDAAVSHGDISLHDTLKAGDVFAFADADMGIDASIIIDVLTIKENGDNGIPTYEITLRDEKQVGTIQKIQNKIDSAFSSAMNGAGGGNGLTPQQIQSLVRKEGNDRYLSKVDDDTAKGNISFEKNINVGGRETVNEIQSSEYTGDGLLDTGYRLWYEEGRAKLVIDDLVARGKFTANELETRIWTYAGGNMVFSGAGSTLFFVEYLDGNENPLGYTYINQPWLLRGRALLAGGLAWSKRKAIQRELTEAEKAQVVKFRCYEYSDDGTMQTRNWWKPNDIAMCETLNKVREKQTSDGDTSGTTSNTVYKRRIAGIGSKEIPMLNDGRVYDYVDLWNIYDLAGNNCKYKDLYGDEVEITDSVKGYDSTYHDWPAAGDVIVQMGNPLDVNRQAAVTIEVQGEGVHGFKVYDTISDYSLENDLWVEIGYSPSTKQAKANVYGDFRFGCRENEEAQGGSYIKYDRSTKQLDIRANVRFMSPTSPQQETTLDSFASAVVGDLSNLQSQIDGQIESWFYNYSPVHVDSEGVPDSNVPLNVAPYSDWITDALKIAHLNDTFTNNETGYCWRFSRNATTNAFEWVIIEDGAVVKALQDAARAQDTADHKRRTFVLPVTIDGVTYNTPYPPYDIGDLWVNATYPTDYTGETDESQHKYKNEILKCATSKAATEVFSINDWELSNGYTQKLKNFVTNTYSPFVTQITEQVDKKAETWRQATDPSSAWYDDTQTPIYDVRIHHVGDLWYNTGNNNNFKYQGTYIYENTGTDANPVYGWVEEAIPDEVFDAIDGKAAIYAGWEDWVVGGVSQLNDKDLYIPNTDYPANNPTYKANKVYRWKASTSTWEEIAYTDDSAFNGYINALLNGTGATGNAATAAAAQKAILDSIDGVTVVNGGLLLSSIIALRKYNGSGDIHNINNYTTWSGMSGQFDSTGTLKGYGLAAWYGGAMVDIEDLSHYWTAAQIATWEAMPAVDKAASALVAKSADRFDGSGYRASGNISWNAAGDLTIKGQVVTATTKIDTPAIFLNGTDITSTLNAILGMFELDTTTISGTTLIKAKYSLYSVGDISAMGQSSGGGGGGGGASVLYELNDVTPNVAGNEVMGIVITDGQTTQGDGYVLTFDGSTKKWKAAPTAGTYVLPQATSGALGGIKIGYTDATVGTRNYAVALDNDGKAYVNVPWTDTTYDLSGYLQRSGGEMSGSITVNADKGINIGSASARVYYEYVYRIFGVQSISASTDGTNVLSLPAKGGTLAVTADIAWSNVSSKPSNIFCYQGEVAAAYVNGTKYSTLDSGTYYIQYSGSSGSMIHFQHGGSASGLDIKFDYTQSADNPLMYRKTIDSNRFASTSPNNGWVNILDSLNSSVSKSGSTLTVKINGTEKSIENTWRPLGTGASDACAGNDSRLSDSRPASDVYSWAKQSTKPSYNLDEVSDGSTRKLSNYLLLSGGTMTGSLNIKADCSSTYMYFYNTAKTDFAGFVGRGSSSSNTIYLNGYTGNAVSIGTNGNSDQVLIDTNGKVGIGNSSPEYKLDVSGTGHFTGHAYFDDWIDVTAGVATNCVELDPPSGSGHGGYIDFHYGGASADFTSRLIESSSGVVTLHGTFYATGDVTAASDQRAKCDIEQIDLSVEQIANAPAVKFSWKDGRDNLRHVGSFAQYWQKVLPESVTDKDDILGLNYGSAALVSVVKVAKKVLTHEDEIEQLKKWYAESQDEIKAQKQRIRELEHEVERLKTA